MLLPRKPIIIVLITIGLLVGGFILLLKGCLSKYDERSAIMPALYFQKDGRGVIFTVVKFDKATSYSRKGNFISKSVSTSYFIQTNEVETGDKTGDRKIRHHSDIRNYPVEVLGAAGNQAWVFMGELMAFDPFTLETKADQSLLEEKNPLLKNKLPGERRFYSYDYSDQSINLVATDGSRWKLNPITLVATENNHDENGVDKMDNKYERLVRQNQASMDSLVEKKLRQPSRMLSAKQITMKEYQRLMEEFRREQSALHSVRDSLNRLSSNSQKSERAKEDERRKLDALRGKTGISFSQAKVNTDTMNGKWYGVYTRQELAKVSDRVQSHTAHDETARRQLIVSTIADQNDEQVFEKNKASVISNSTFFLNGGFLLNKNTGNPIHRGNNFFVVHKNSIGNEGMIQLTIIDTTGQALMTFDSQLKEWADWIYTDNHLLVFGKDNKDLSGNEVNVFFALNLTTGKVVRYDFFQGK
jgi:hypothetical protein